jgi:hypothetical protein
MRARTVGFVRWIVDAMNVIGTRPDGWWKDRRRVMVGLVDQLERWASAEGHHEIKTRGSHQSVVRKADPGSTIRAARSACSRWETASSRPTANLDR